MNPPLCSNLPSASAVQYIYHLSGISPSEATVAMLSYPTVRREPRKLMTTHLEKDRNAMQKPSLSFELTLMIKCGSLRECGGISLKDST